MTIMDSRLEFADATAINTGGVASYLVGNVIDLNPTSVAPNTVTDIGTESDMYLVISVDTSLASATGSLKFSLCSDAQAAIAVDGTATYHFTTGAKLAAAVVAGTTVAVVQLPAGSYERYLGIVQETITAAFTAGKINAYLTSDPTVWRPFADNVN